MPENDNKEKKPQIKDRIATDIKKISRKRNFAIIFGIAVLVLISIVVSLLFIFNSPGPDGKNHELEDELEQSIQEQNTPENGQEKDSQENERKNKVKEKNIKEDSENMDDIDTLTDADDSNNFGQIFH